MRHVPWVINLLGHGLLPSVAEGTSQWQAAGHALAVTFHEGGDHEHQQLLKQCMGSKQRARRGR